MATRSVSPPASAMLGYLVQHHLFGCCKVVSIDGGRIAMYLCDQNDRRYFSRQALEGPDFTRVRLRPGALATGPDGRCSIDAALDLEGPGPRRYRVRYEDGGLSATLSEIEIIPLPASLTDSLPNRLIEGRTDPFATFLARHRLLVALGRLNRQVGGLRVLLASRIDLHPHQAFVAGTVVLDPVRRYVLADEVGLGKTIEAGIILHDLLSRRPDARVLVLAPGPLTRQWLCEMHSSFGGQGFRLADLHPIEAVDLQRWSKVICSTNLALDGLDEDLLLAKWDLVIVDEVHHLLNSPHLYDLVYALSLTVRDLLLLSAVPVRQREVELYRLLALLDPRTYGDDGTDEAVFLEIYAAQEPIGRRLNLLSHDLADLATGEATAEDVLSRLGRLLSLPILQDDPELQGLLAAAEADPARAGFLAQQAHAIVSDRYRVNRRILRNRRERLISQERLTAITRAPSLLRYEPDQIEAEAVAAVEALLSSLAEDPDLTADIRRPFARLLLQASVDPFAVLDVLDALARAAPARVNSYGIEMLNAVVGMGGERWPILLDTVCAGVKAHVDPVRLADTRRRATDWRASRSSSERWDALTALLAAEIGRGRKTLVFAGFPGVAGRLAERLRTRFGAEVVTEFRSDLDDMIKEENVRRFRVEPARAIMVSDESGGEGRNFQFAHSLVHADLPWQPAVIEQRIGRLDRLGRETVSTEVISHVCVGAGTWEEGLYACFHEGLNLFGRSVSGLEFALRHLQDEIVDAALTGSADALRDLAPHLSEAAAAERVRDDSEALLDDASFNAARAERFARTPAPETDLQLEAAFLDHFRALTGGKGVSRVKVTDGLEGVWRLRPDEVRHGEIAIVDRKAAGQLGARVGTFRREIAQRERDIEFFTYGNPLFDAVVVALGQRLTGRTYAIACQAPGAGRFVGLEMIIAARLDAAAADLSPSFLNLADAIFGTRRRPLFVPIVRDQAVDGPALASLRASLTTTGDGSRWRDLAANEVQRLVERHDGELAACLQHAFDHILPEARRTLANELAEPLAAERVRVEASCRALRDAGGATAIAEAEMLDRYLTLIEGWDLVLDGVGFLAVN